MSKILTISALLLLCACTPHPDVDYCKKFNVLEGHPEYPACIAYYAKMDRRFTDDLAPCQSKAADSIPDYLYDHPHYAEVSNIGPFGRPYYSNILIEPDYARNNSLDRERRKIIAPCMQKKGWNSPDTWQAGRVGEKPDPRAF